LDVDGFIRLRTLLPVDARTVGYVVASAKRPLKGRRVSNARTHILDTPKGKDLSRPRAPILTPGNKDDVIAACGKRGREVTTDEARTSSDRYPHSMNIE